VRKCLRLFQWWCSTLATFAPLKTSNLNRSSIGEQRVIICTRGESVASGTTGISARPQVSRSACRAAGGSHRGESGHLVQRTHAALGVFVTSTRSVKPFKLRFQMFVDEHQRFLVRRANLHHTWRRSNLCVTPFPFSWNAPASGWRTVIPDSKPGSHHSPTETGRLGFKRIS
jgi:hypothetical protein